MGIGQIGKTNHNARNSFNFSEFLNSQTIDRSLQEPRVSKRIFFFGRHGAGCSTMIKHCLPATHDHYIPLIQRYIVVALKLLVSEIKNICITTDISFKTESKKDPEINLILDKNLYEEAAKHIESLSEKDLIDSKSVSLIKSFWSSIAPIKNHDRGPSKLSTLMSSLPILHSVEYFVESIERIARSDYVPTMDDIYRCYDDLYLDTKSTDLKQSEHGNTRPSSNHTQGDNGRDKQRLEHYKIQTNKVVHSGKRFELIHVPIAMRGHYRKWIHCFGEVDCFVYMVDVTSHLQWVDPIELVEILNKLYLGYGCLMPRDVTSKIVQYVGQDIENMHHSIHHHDEDGMEQFRLFKRLAKRGLFGNCSEIVIAFTKHDLFKRLVGEGARLASAFFSGSNASDNDKYRNDSVLDIEDMEGIIYRYYYFNVVANHKKFLHIEDPHPIWVSVSHPESTLQCFDYL